METNRLRQFCAICETNSLRAAAELLGVTHSALSKSMKVLQEEVQEDLLAPDGRGILVTDAGLRFYRKCQVFLSSEAELLKKEDPVNSLRIGTFEVFSTYLLPSVWKDYFPELGLELLELLPGRIEEEVEAGAVDVGITRDPVPRVGIEFLKVTSARNGVFIRRGAFSGISFSDLPYVTPLGPGPSAPGPRGLDGWPHKGHERLVRHQVSMLESGLGLARRGEAAIYLPAFVARLHNDTHASKFQLEEVRPPRGFPSEHQQIYIVKRKTTTEDHRLKRLARLLRSECRG